MTVSETQIEPSPSASLDKRPASTSSQQTDVQLASYPPTTKAKDDFDTASIHRKATAMSTASTRPAVFKNLGQEVACVAVLTLAVGLVSITSGITLVTSNLIGENLSMDAAGITWLNASSTLTGGAFLLFFGRTADMFGRKKVLLASFISYVICTVITGFATDAAWMDSMRGLQGLCASAAIPASSGILGAIYRTPSPRKNKAFAAFSGGNPLGFVFGAFLAGVATQILSWRASFWFIAILYAVASVLAYFYVPSDEPIEEGYWALVKKLDWIGAFLLITGFAGIIVALTQSGSTDKGWKEPYIIAVLILGFLLFFSFLFWQTKAAHPLMPLSIFADRQLSILIVLQSCGFSGFACGMWWISLYFQQIKNASALTVATWILPQAVGGLLTNLAAGFVLHRIDNRWLMLGGMVAYAASNLLYSFENPGSSFWDFVFMGGLLSVVGADLVFNIANIYILSSISKQDQSLAAGIFATAMNLSAALSLGITTTIYASIAPRDTLLAFRAVFWYCMAVTFASIAVMPMLKIKFQGQKQPKLSSTELERQKSHVTEIEVSAISAAVAPASYPLPQIDGLLDRDQKQD